MKGLAVFISLVLMLQSVLIPGAMSEGAWYTFSPSQAPEDLAYLVMDDDLAGRVTLTFLGDCTLGGEEASRGNANSFAQTVKRNGMAFPMRNLSALTLSDDLTVANLEGVLSDRKLEKTEKAFHFIGRTGYTAVLTEGGIDCVSLANNHSHDYGNEGYRDTRSALQDAGVACFGTDDLAVWVSDGGIMIGFVGVLYSLSGTRGRTFDRQMAVLQDLGCNAIVVVMHAGKEYDGTPTGYQRQIARRAQAKGAALVVGHHPHIVQGYEVFNGMPVVYSLGNCAFGGRLHPTDSDALALQAEMTFAGGELTQVDLHFFPISITSDRTVNNYSPMFLTGEDAGRVIEKMRKSTGCVPDEVSDDGSAWVHCPVP